MAACAKMPVKPNAKTLTILEQGIEDLVTGLTLRFEAYENQDKRNQFKLTIYGDFPYGNRELIFDATGVQTDSGSAVSCNGCDWMDIRDKDYD